MPESTLLSLPQAATLLGLSRQRLHILIQEGKMPAVKVGNRWLLLRSQIEAFQEARR